MTPKEKANELICNFYSITTNDPEYGIDWKMAKESALIAVDEILKLLKSEGILIGSYYWIEVKQEIERP